jgi:hypothetical protein
LLAKGREGSDGRSGARRVRYTEEEYGKGSTGERAVWTERRIECIY